MDAGAFLNHFGYLGLKESESYSPPRLDKGEKEQWNNMKRNILIISFILFGTNLYAETTQQKDGENTKLTSIVVQPAIEDIQTVYTYTIREVTYPIWITPCGHCYIIRISRKGNPYKLYLSTKISRKISAEMGIEYVE